MLIDGPDHSNMMAKEVWTGTTYALAAAMLQVVCREGCVVSAHPNSTQGMVDEAMTTASGIYNTVYNDFGLGFV